MLLSVMKIVARGFVVTCMEILDCYQFTVSKYYVITCLERLEYSFVAKNVNHRKTEKHKLDF